HLLTEVEELCNRVAIIRKGRIVYEGSLAELMQAGGHSWRLRASDPNRAKAIALNQGVTDIAALDGELSFAGDEEAVARLTVALGQAGIGITRLGPHAATLEELFLELTEPDDAPRQEVAA